MNKLLHLDHCKEDERKGIDVPYFELESMATTDDFAKEQVTLVVLAEEAEKIAATYSVVTTVKSRGSFYSGSFSETDMRPEDILTSSNGKTIEVNNIDAEGKLNA
ncbi:S-locus glycoprotein domain-containing protein [Artemisia annua]|uniref:S-locus glycoprotein domain-containing protein n=1 Tax=Artemisia annua TaxID=35608 RepID=A0A2U1PZD9_ARTAN|nr:S-locus glycoprotein domain-containing protein [Artemisia annua]